MFLIFVWILELHKFRSVNVAAVSFEVEGGNPLEHWILSALKVLQ